MKLMIFPTAMGLLVMAEWVAVAVIEDCLLGRGDGKFDCWSATQVVVLLGAISAALAAVTAGLVRAFLRGFLPVGSLAAEFIAAGLASLALVLIFTGAIHWQLNMGGMAGIFFGWIFACAVLSGAALIAVKHLTTRP
ncbi:MAG: hypothetical protein AAF495_04490 [Pseudomonadota bacterium]